MNLALSPEQQEHHPVAVNWTRNDLSIERALALTIFPELVVHPGIKRSKPVLSGNENLCLTVMFDDKRRSVGSPNRSVLPPGDFPGLLIQPDQETRALVVIPWE